MLAKVFSSALIGIDALLVDVEVDLAPGLPVPDGAVKEIGVIGATTLAQVVEFLSGRELIEPCRVDLQAFFSSGCDYGEDFSEVKGQEHAKRAL